MPARFFALVIRSGRSDTPEEYLLDKPARYTYLWFMTSARHTESQTASLSISEAARRVGFSVDTLRRWSDEGRLPSYRTPGNQRRFYIDDLDSFLDHPSTPTARPVDDLPPVSAGRALPSGDAA